MIVSIPRLESATLSITICVNMWSDTTSAGADDTCIACLMQHIVVKQNKAAIKRLWRGRKLMQYITIKGKALPIQA